MLELSFNQETVHKLLQASDKPLKAYNILFETQKLGIKSPTQVYRALDKLIELGKVPAWGVFLILGRELTIAGWRVNQSKISGANIWGKLKTISQIIAVALLITPLPKILATIGIVMFWVSVALTIISGIIYLLPHKEVRTI